MKCIDTPPTCIYSEEELELICAEKIPQHIAIIMDGNRRWAKEQGLPSIVGHWKGADTLTRIVRAAEAIGIKALTVFAFSTENWGRAPQEVSALMELFKTYLQNQRETMIREGVRLSAIGDLSKMPEDVIREFAISQASTEQCKKIDLVLAFNYGGRDDIRRAVVAMMEDFKNGKLTKEDVTECAIGRYLDTAQWPDPDMLIRTSGERRQSNFLLWQLSYSEFYHTDVLWPDFDEQQLLHAVIEFQKRQRRLGG